MTGNPVLVDLKGEGSRMPNLLIDTNGINVFSVLIQLPTSSEIIERTGSVQGDRFSFFVDNRDNGALFVTLNRVAGDTSLEFEPGVGTATIGPEELVEYLVFIRSSNRVLVIRQ